MARRDVALIGAALALGLAWAASAQWLTGRFDGSEVVFSHGRMLAAAWVAGLLARGWSGGAVAGMALAAGVTFGIEAFPAWGLEARIAEAVPAEDVESIASGFDAQSDPLTVPVALAAPCGAAGWAWRHAWRPAAIAGLALALGFDAALWDAILELRSLPDTLFGQVALAEAVAAAAIALFATRPRTAAVAVLAVAALAAVGTADLASDQAVHSEITVIR